MKNSEEWPRVKCNKANLLEQILAAQKNESMDFQFLQAISKGNDILENHS